MLMHTASVSAYTCIHTSLEIEERPKGYPSSSLPPQSHPSLLCSSLNLASHTTISGLRPPPPPQTSSVLPPTANSNTAAHRHQIELVMVQESHQVALSTNMK